jgi:hypothetical protein
VLALTAKQYWHSLRTSSRTDDGRNQRPYRRRMITTHTHPHTTRVAGRACASGAALGVAVAVATQVVQESTDVPKDQWSYPWWNGVSISFWLVAALAHALIAVGVIGLLLSGAAGSTRVARLGLTVALGGAVLIVAGHLASIPIRKETTHDTWPQIIGGAFGIGTILVAIGLLLAGWTTLQERNWDDWRRFTPLAAGAWAVALIPLQLTSVVPSALAVYGLCFVAIGMALGSTPTSCVTQTHARAQQA